jgi:hypothetical protein
MNEGKLGSRSQAPSSREPVKPDFGAIAKKLKEKNKGQENAHKENLEKVLQSTEHKRRKIAEEKLDREIAEQKKAEEVARKARAAAIDASKHKKEKDQSSCDTNPPSLRGRAQRRARNPDIVRASVPVEDFFCRLKIERTAHKVKPRPTPVRIRANVRSIPEPHSRALEFFRRKKIIRTWLNFSVVTMWSPGRNFDTDHYQTFEFCVDL